jgi:hypothetical protein
MQTLCGEYFTGRSSHIIIGPADKVGAIFANKEARAVGLSEKVKKARADVNDSGAASGRDLAKPIVSNVTAPAVQANMASPRAPSISEDHDQAQPDQKPVSTSTPAADHHFRPIIHYLGCPLDSHQHHLPSDDKFKSVSCCLF